MGIISDLLSLLYPQYCFTCHTSLYKGEKYICTRCIAGLPKTNHHLKNDNPLYSKLLNIKSLQYATSYLTFIKKGKVQKLIHYYKYKNYPEIGATLGKWYAKDLQQLEVSQYWEVIIPVPLHEKKLKKRGYNQSAYFAQGLAAVLNIPTLEHSLIRKEYSSTQTSKSKTERWKNVEQIFAVVDQKAIDNKHVLLVDDIITTGSTLEACAYQLENSGASAISIATLALAD